MQRFLRGPWWVWVAAIPFGFGVWATVVPGVQCRRWSWVALGILWTGVVYVGSSVDDLGWANDNTAGGLTMLGWAGGLATALAIRPLYLEESMSELRLERKAAARRLRDRRKARRLAVENPVLAREISTGSRRCTSSATCSTWTAMPSSASATWWSSCPARASQ